MDALTDNKVPIRDQGDDLNLTDMWVAAGSPKGKRPANWRQGQGKAFIAFMAQTLGVSIRHCWRDVKWGKIPY
jgi:hypothetical protein